jgi:hypothetical protein
VGDRPGSNVQGIGHGLSSWQAVFPLAWEVATLWNEKAAPPAEQLQPVGT